MDVPGWQLELGRPAWLLGLLVVPLLWYSSRRSLAGFGPRRRWVSLLVRSVLVADLVLVLAGLRLIYPFGDRFVLVAIDRSASIGPQAKRAMSAYLDEAIPDPATKVLHLPFAGRWAVTADRRAAVDSDFETPFRAAYTEFGPGLYFDAPGAARGLCPGMKDLRQTIYAACCLMPHDFVPTVVLFSDGSHTVGDPLHAAREASKKRIPISTVPLDPDPEVAVTEIRLPREASEAEPFSAEAVLHSDHDDEGAVELICSSKPAVEKRVRVVRGENRVELKALAAGSGKTTVSATIRGFHDRFAENNSVVGSMLVTPRARVLLVAAEPKAADAVASALQEAHIPVERRGLKDIPATPAQWEGVALTILSNVPAEAMTPAQMVTLRDYVRDSGGLIVIGGDRSFTPGGYHKTPLEHALPVISTARPAKRPSVALVLVVDRSQSMGTGGAIELAKEAMRRAVETLAPEDQIGALAFDEASQWLSPIQRLTDKAQVLRDIKTLTAGGRTDMGPAIDKAYLALREASAQRKHIIVLTDGISHPADFEGLARQIADSGITLSTVALGKEPSRPLLETLARIGKGHFYACDNPADIPTIFERDTTRALAPGIREGATPVRVRCAVPLLAGLDFSHAPALSGYVETVAKPASETILVSEAGDPLLARWRFGSGTAIAFTSDAGDRWAAAWLSWPSFRPFWVQLARFAMRPVDTTPRVFQAEYPQEFRVRPANRDLLRQIADVTGGTFDPPPSSLLAPDGRTVPRTLPLGYFLLAAAAVIFTLDVAVRRWPL